MLGSQLSHSLEVNLLPGRRHIKQEFLCEGTILNIAQDLLHGLLCLLSDQLGTGDVIAVLCCVGNGISHSSETALVDQIYDQLHLVDTLKVCISGIVASLNQRLKACLHQCTYAAAQHSLLAKQIGLCLSAEGCLKHTGSCSADAERICQCQILSLSGSVLLYSDQTGHTFALLILASYGMSGSLGRDHGNVNVCGGNDTAEVNIEAMCKHQHISGFQIRLNVILIKVCLLLIIDQNHDDVSLLCCLCGSIYLKALLLGFLPRLGALVQTNNDMTA